MNNRRFVQIVTAIVILGMVISVLAAAVAALT